MEQGLCEEVERLGTTGIRLQTAAGTPLFDSEGQVQGMLEVKVSNDMVTYACTGSSFGG